MLSDLLPHTVNIQRRTLSSDGMGGQDETWTTVKSSVKCRIWTPKHTLGRLDSGQAEIADRRMAIKKNQDLQLLDKVIHGTENYFLGKDYPVYDASKLHHYEYDLYLNPKKIGS